MTPAQTILKMIEEVDPGDRDGLGKIECAVECWLQKKELKLKHLGHSDFSSDWVYLDPDDEGALIPVLIPQYTRSRDALKAIRPEGWITSKIQAMMVVAEGIVWQASTDKIAATTHMVSPFLPTEELAELHAIIQAVEYERGKAVGPEEGYISVPLKDMGSVIGQAMEDFVEAKINSTRSAALDEMTAIAQATGQYPCPKPGHEMHEGNCVTCYMEAKDVP